MSYLVSLQEVEMPYGFTTAFSKAEREAILLAAPGIQFKLRRGTACVQLNGNLALVLRSPGGYSHHYVDYAEICRQLRAPADVTLYVHGKNRPSSTGEQ